MAVGSRMSGHLECPVGVSQRLADAVVASGVSFDRESVRGVIRSVAETEAPLAGPDDIQGVVDLLVGLGPVEPILRDRRVTDVFVNGPDEIWVDRGTGLERAAVCFPNEESIVASVERVITPLGLRIDRGSPIVDARLSDGSRLHAIVPPASPDGPRVAIRRFTQAVPTFDALEASGVASAQQIGEISRMVDERSTFLVSGGTGAGKTTLLNLIGALFTDERVVVIEDAAELQIPGHVVRLEAQPANAEGRGAVTMSDLVRASLRLRPDRIVIGEVRGHEALDLVGALNTGHEGSLSTIHANGPREALWRLEMLASQAAGAVASELIRRQIDHSILHAVHVERKGSQRRITHVGRIPA